MTCDPRFAALFEPIKIGPVWSRNRFYQVPHCSGMGYALPNYLAAMREVKAEGGWGVVCSEYCSVHPATDDTPWPYATLWDDDDVRVHSALTDRIHLHGALAGVELWIGGVAAPNRLTREVPLGPSSVSVSQLDPVQTRAMTKSDIAEMRRAQVNGAKLAMRAGYDIVYVYCGNGCMPFEFLSRRLNHRSDEYGGRLENRARLFREMIEDTKEAVGDRCAIAVRFAVEEFLGKVGVTSEGEGCEVIEMLAELPDLWDINVSNWANESCSSRFASEAWLESHVRFVKNVTTKPVVGVGRFTSPDVMVRQLKEGILDLIGAARPSIADPFLPRKIQEGRLDEIRECIGCNICVATNNNGAPIRCTQNPTMGEEYRRGWHPERLAPRGSDASILIVGSGPAGLECARVLGQRGYEVHLAEAKRELGGRVSVESQLPGLATWARVRDYRMMQINKMSNVGMYRESLLGADDIVDLGFNHVVIATGAAWRLDGVGRTHTLPIHGFDQGWVFGPEAVLGGQLLEGPIIVYDDDHYYMGGVLAERLRLEGSEVTIVTPAPLVSAWAVHTLEQSRIQARLLELGVRVCTSTSISAIGSNELELSCVFTGRTRRWSAGTLVMVTSRIPHDRIYYELQVLTQNGQGLGQSRTVTAIGDCSAPGTIAAAVYSGHRYAQELDFPQSELLRDRVVVFR